MAHTNFVSLILQTSKLEIYDNVVHNPLQIQTKTGIENRQLPICLKYISILLSHKLEFLGQTIILLSYFRHYVIGCFCFTILQRCFEDNESFLLKFPDFSTDSLRNSLHPPSDTYLSHGYIYQYLSSNQYI